MKGQDFTTTLLVDQSPRVVFDAINNVRGWWSQNIAGDTDRLHGEFIYRYQDTHVTRMQVIELVEDRKVVWKVLDNYFNFTEDQHEWKGDRIVFEITPKNGQTGMRFTHEGLSPESECYDACYAGWTRYAQNSLRELIETGKGKPNPQEPGSLEAKQLKQFDLQG